MFHVSRVIQEIHGGIGLSQEQFNDQSHGELDDVAIDLALQ